MRFPTRISSSTLLAVAAVCPALAAAQAPGNAPQPSGPASPSPASPGQPPVVPAPGTPAPATPAPGTATPAGPGPGATAPQAGSALTLEEASRYAVEHNPRIAGAAADVRAARARVTQRASERRPQTGVNNFIIRQGPTVPGFQPGAPPAVPAYRYNLGVFISQILLDWGQRAQAERAARRQVEASQFRQRETANDVRLVVGVAFYNVLRGAALVNVAEERLRSTQEQLRVTRARFESDIAPRFDVLRSEAEVGNAEAELIQAQNERALAEAAFNTALGREVTTPVVLQPAEETLPEDLPFDRLREVALQQRPSLRAQEALIRSDEALVRSRKAEKKPQVSGTATYDRPNPGGFASTDYRWTVGLFMNWPFFDSGFNRGRVREAEALTEADRAELERQRQQVELDVRQAQLDLLEARRRIDAARTEQVSAREALRVAEVRYRAGVGTNVEVTDAQLAVARAGQNLANARFDYLTAIERLRFSTGSSLSELGRRSTP